LLTIVRSVVHYTQCTQIEAVHSVMSKVLLEPRQSAIVGS